MTVRQKAKERKAIFSNVYQRIKGGETAAAATWNGQDQDKKWIKAHGADLVRGTSIGGDRKIKKGSEQKSRERGQQRG